MAAQAEIEEAGNAEYADNHMAAIFKEGMSFSGYERDYLGMSDRGERLIDISGVSGLDSIGDGRGAAFADFDNDGDTDIVLVSLQRDGHELFRNNVGSDRGFVRVRLIGAASGLDAFGAVVRVKTAAGIQTAVKSAGSGFLAQNDPRLLFGLGDSSGAEWIEVAWPSGAQQRVSRLPGSWRSGIPAGTTLEITEGGRNSLVAESRFSLVDPLSSEERLLTSLTFRPGEVFPDLQMLTKEQIPDGAKLAGPDPASLRQLLSPGRRLLVNLWATWCVPCRLEMPELQGLQSSFDAQGIDLVGVSIDTQTLGAVAGYVEQIGARYPIYVSQDQAVADLYVGGRISVPLSVLLDDTGRVMQVIGGWSAATAESFERLAGQAASAAH